MTDPARTAPVWISEPPLARVVEQHTGTITDATVIRDIDELIVDRDTSAATYAAAVGAYDCPCGSVFEFTESMGLEDYATLNRWLGKHVGQCGGGQVAPIKQRDDARAELDNMVNLTIEVGRLGTYLKHVLADRDDWREMSDDWREKYNAAQYRMDEMVAEIRELSRELAAARAERDTAVIR